MKNVCLIIPAYNEQERIARTMNAYVEFFNDPERVAHYKITFLIVLNGCVDNTRSVVENLRSDYSNIEMIELGQAGKGIAIKAGFSHALHTPYDLIGFVDADMATIPAELYKLILACNEVDGVIASRYMQGAICIPERPFIKRWGSWLIYETLITLFFGLRYHDYQCGAKIFKRNVIAAVTPRLTVTQWAFDVELLYWCKRLGFHIKEVPTVWHDQAGSKLRILGSGLPMLSALIKLWWQVRNTPT